MFKYLYNLVFPKPKIVQNLRYRYIFANPDINGSYYGKWNEASLFMREWDNKRLDDTFKYVISLFDGLTDVINYEWERY